MNLFLELIGSGILASVSTVEMFLKVYIEISFL